MNLPYRSDLNEFNRVLIAVQQLSCDSGSCQIRPVLNTCSSLTFGGHAVDHYRTIQLCRDAWLVSLTKGQITITEFGKKFLQCNPENLYEITDSQKSLLADEAIFHGPWHTSIKKLLLVFCPNYDKITYELDLYDNAVPRKYNSVIQMLIAIGVLIKQGNLLWVEPKYVSLAKWLRAEDFGLSADELEQALSGNLKLSQQAEDAVVEYEKSRLIHLGRQLEATRVRKISLLNVKAGYDIESFDGDKSFFDFDRFIEVKASAQPGLRFFWTENEKRVAQKKKDSYWIYFVGNMTDGTGKNIKPIMIQNPAAHLHEIPNINIKTAVYLIEQIDELNLTSISYGDKTGALLQNPLI